MIEYFYRESLTKSQEKNQSFKTGSWICVTDPSDKEITSLAEEFDLELGHLQDALDPFEVPRLELEDNAAYFFVRAPVKSKQGMETQPFLIVLGEQFLLTICQESLPILEKFINGNYKVYTTQKLDFIAQLISAISASYSRNLMEISRQVRSIRVRLERIENGDIIKFVDFEQVLNDFISALIPMSGSLRGLLRSQSLNLQEEHHDLFEDLLLNNEQLIESAKANLKTIVNIRDAYSTIMSQDLNKIIKILTSLTIIVTVPTMISSFYGMNIDLPFQRSPLAFSGVVGVTLLSVGIFWFVFKKNRWL
ncbi:MAG: magnesium transporter CorA family protein [Candidatus Falkowbacteria bacterium]